MHISEIKTIKPESVAFIAYVMSNSYNVPFASLNASTGHNIPFLKTTIKEVMQFSDGGSFYLEASIIYTKVDEGNASALMVRVFKDGVLDKEDVTFLHFIMRPFSASTLRKAIEEFPQLPIMDKKQVH